MFRYIERLRHDCEANRPLRDGLQQQVLRRAAVVQVGLEDFYGIELDATVTSGGLWPVRAGAPEGAGSLPCAWA